MTVVEDLNARSARLILEAVPRASELHSLVRLSWTQADIVQDALSRWAFGADAPAGIGALPDWECHYLSLLLDQAFDNFLKTLDEPPDLIGISVCDNGLLSAIGLSRRFRKLFPRTLIVWGGVSISEDQAPAVIRHVPEIDALVVGEGEQAILDLVDAFPDLSRCASSNIIIREKENSILSSRREYLPSEPAYDLFDLSLYPALELPMSIARGCSWGKCVFCNENYAGSSYRAVCPERSAEWALEWQSRYRPVSFELVDSAANASRPAFHRFVERLLERGGLREWRCMMRTAGLAREDLEKAVKSGLRTVYLGLESFDSEVLRRMQKGATVAHHLRAIRNALDLGLQVEGDLILFFPGDTTAAVQRTIDLFQKYDHLFAKVGLSFSRFVPGLRSEIEGNATEYGIHTLPHSLRLGRHMPRDLASALIPWDPVWGFDNEDSKAVRELARAYLELQGVVTELKRKNVVTRTCYDAGGSVVLETRGEQSPALDRIFLEGKQAEIWNSHSRPKSAEQLAHSIGVDSASAENFLHSLVERAFIYRDNTSYIQMANSDAGSRGRAAYCAKSAPAPAKASATS
jgi:pyruvate-formate lyase-activating enzyme